MDKYVTGINENGEPIINVDAICDNWGDRFLINTWINSHGEKYTFIIMNSKGKITYKINISKEYANEIISRLSLIHIKETELSLSGNYHSKSFIEKEINRLNNLKSIRERELYLINSILKTYIKNI